MDSDLVVTLICQVLMARESRSEGGGLLRCNLDLHDFGIVADPQPKTGKSVRTSRRQRLAASRLRDRPSELDYGQLCGQETGPDKLRPGWDGLTELNRARRKGRKPATGLSFACYRLDAYRGSDALSATIRWY